MQLIPKIFVKWAVVKESKCATKLLLLCFYYDVLISDSKIYFHTVYYLIFKESSISSVKWKLKRPGKSVPLIIIQSPTKI